MKILLIGNNSNWMKIHLAQMTAGFINNGHTVRIADYNELGLFAGFLKLHEKISFELRQQKLEKLVKKFEPDLILFIISHLKFDFTRLKSYYRGVIAIHDYDGPNWSCLNHREWLKDIDVLLTVSRPIAAQLRSQDLNAHYLPHGVDVNYYSPGQLSALEHARFAAPVSYIGKATPRRLELCRQLTDKGLALYGRRWRQLAGQDDIAFQKCIRGKDDVIGHDVVKIYRASGCMINTLQETLAKHQTILSLQVFAVPATASCLITEYVSELPEAFEIGRELLCYQTADELSAQVDRVLKEPGWAQKIGDAGRRRCQDCHTHEIRGKELLKLCNF